MGCFSSKQDDYEDYVAAIEQGGRIGRTKHYKKPVWQSDEPITKAQLQVSKTWHVNGTEGKVVQASQQC